MSVEEYEKKTVSKFMGLFVRGTTDSCPPDHSPNCQNVGFNRKGETYTRTGSLLSFNAGHSVKRMFIASFDNNTNILLSCDGAGNIYRHDTGGVLLSVSGMVDFAAFNTFNFCLICPILNSPRVYNPIYIWNPTTVPIRPAAGPPPVSDFTATESATAGDCDIGIHKFAVSFITNSGYTTQPGPFNAVPPDPAGFKPVSVTSTGSLKIDLSGIPTGPAGTVARQIFATKADQELFFYVPNGLINDNSTGSLTVNFFDTDLAVSADDLFDLLPVIPAGTYGLAGGIAEYHGRTFFWGGELDLIRVTNPGDCESINNVTGFIQLPTKSDGNIVRGSCSLQDVLYFTKAFGVFSVTDNGDVPSSWAIIPIDPGVGSSAQGMGTINMSYPSLSQNNIILMSDFGGLYRFNGSVQQPPLTWKINDIWQQIAESTNITVTLQVQVDPYNKLIYILSAGNKLIVGDYNDGLDEINIKWTQYTFPYTPDCIGMGFIQDLTSLSYRLRIGAGNSIYKIEPGTTSDFGNSINSVYALYYAFFGEGALNIYRYIRARVVGIGILNITVTDEDNVQTLIPAPFTLTATPGRDYTREINFSNEKASVVFSMNRGVDRFTLVRADVFGKVRFPMRASV